MNTRLSGIVLLTLSALVIAAMLIHNNHLWSVVDLLVILGCGTIGVLLLRKK
jgi:hypothetical protein